MRARLPAEVNSSYVPGPCRTQDVLLSLFGKRSWYAPSLLPRNKEPEPSLDANLCISPKHIPKAMSFSSRLMSGDAKIANIIRGQFFPFDLEAFLLVTSPPNLCRFPPLRGSLPRFFGLTPSHLARTPTSSARLDSITVNVPRN